MERPAPDAAAADGPPAEVARAAVAAEPRREELMLSIQALLDGQRRIEELISCLACAAAVTAKVEGLKGRGAPGAEPAAAEPAVTPRSRRAEPPRAEPPRAARRSQTWSASEAPAGDRRQKLDDPSPSSRNGSVAAEMRSNSRSLWARNIEIRRGLDGDDEGLEMACKQTLCGGTQSLDTVGGGSDALGQAPGASGLAARSSRNISSPPLIMRPTSRSRLVVDLLSLFFVSYDMLSLPYLVAFDVPYEGFVLYLSCSAALFWMLDIGLTFRTGIYVNGELELRPHVIRRRYCRGLFSFDLCLVVLDVGSLILNSLDTSRHSTNSFKVGRILKFFRLSRCLNVLRLNGISESIRNMCKTNLYVHATTVVLAKVVKLTSVILWLNHAIACIWISIGASHNTDTGFTWLDNETVMGSYRNAQDFYKYTTALHWAMTQMTPGSMQVFPVNSYERIFNTMCLVFGLLVFSTLISSISATVAHFKIKMQTNSVKMDTLHRFLEASDISLQLAAQVRMQVSAKLKAPRPLVVQDVEVLEGLSLPLRSQLQMELCSPHLVLHTYFCLLIEADATLAERLCRTCAAFSVLMNKDALFMAGEKAIGMHCLTKGSITYTPVASDHTPQRRRDQETVGVGRWFCEAAVWCYWTHCGNAEVTPSVKVAWCEVLTVSADSFVKLMRSHGGVGAQLTAAYAAIFFELLTNYSDEMPHSRTPSDTHLPFTTDDVVWMMPSLGRSLLGYLCVRLLRRSERSRRSGRSWLAMPSRRLDYDWLEGLVREGDAVLAVTEAEADDTAWSTMTSSLGLPGGAAQVLLGSGPAAADRVLGVHRLRMEVVLRAFRAGGRMLLLVGLERPADGGAPRAFCRLPSVECRPGESRRQALERLNDDLRPLQGCALQVTRAKKRERWAEWKGVPTRVVTAIVTCTCDEDSLMSEATWSWAAPPTLLDDMDEDSPPPSDATLALPTPSSRDVAADVLRLPDGRSAAWLTSNDAEFLSRPAGQDTLMRWLVAHNTEVAVPRSSLTMSSPVSMYM